MIGTHPIENALEPLTLMTMREPIYHQPQSSALHLQIKDGLSAPIHLPDDGKLKKNVAFF